MENHVRSHSISRPYVESVVRGVIDVSSRQYQKG
jgi:hypothetical protein